MKIYLLVALVMVASWFIGVWGFCQIIGSLQRIGTPQFSKCVFALILWSAIIIACIILMHAFFSDYLIAFYIGLGVSLLQSLSAGKIE